jgi:hypothetical protein
LAAWAVAAMLQPAMAKQPEKPADAPVESVITTQVDGSLTFGTTGEVESYQIDTKVMDPIRLPLENAVRKWKFKPVLVDGVPRRAFTRMRVTLAAKEVAGGLQVKVDNVVFPIGKGEVVTRVDGEVEPITGKKLGPPSYPFGLMRQGVGGMVLLAIRVDAEGRAAEVLPVQSMLFDVSGRPKTLHGAILLLEKSAATAAKAWTFNVPATARPRTAEHMTITVPIEYTVDSKPLPAGQWRTVVRVPKREIGWLKPAAGTQSVGVADAVSGEVIPLTTSVALATDVIGSELL